MTTIKGTGLRASVDCMRAACDQMQWRQVLATFEDSERTALLGVQKASEYPLKLADRLFRSYADVVCSGSHEASRDALVAIGRCVAKTDLSGVYKVATSWVSPGLLARFLPRQWQLYFPGVDVSVEEIDLEERRVVNVVRGLEELTYISPVASGWMAAAFERLGLADVLVRESSYESGATAGDELRFEITWSQDET